MTREIHLGMFVPGAGNHVAGWRPRELGYSKHSDCVYRQQRAGSF